MWICYLLLPRTSIIVLGVAPSQEVWWVEIARAVGPGLVWWLENSSRCPVQRWTPSPRPTGRGPFTSPTQRYSPADLKSTDNLPVFVSCCTPYSYLPCQTVMSVEERRKVPPSAVADSGSVLKAALNDTLWYVLEGVAGFWNIWC